MIEQAAISCAPFGRASVVAISGVEGMNARSRFDVDVLAAEATVDLEAVLGAPAALALADDAGNEREIPLFVVAARYVGHHRDGHRYRLELGSLVWPLDLRSNHRVFQDKTTREIVLQVLEDSGIETAAISFRLSGNYAKRVYCVQYGETDGAFVRRLLADEGIAFWFEETDDHHPRIVLGDGPSAHDSVVGEMNFRFEDESGMVGSTSALHQLSRTVELTHDKTVIRDYDVQAPGTPITGEAGEGEGELEYYEYPAAVPNADAAAFRANVRLEQLQRFKVRVEAECHDLRPQPGRVIRIVGADDDDANGEHLVVEVRHELVQATASHADGARHYKGHLVMVPHGERTFRPALPEAVPAIGQIETATVTGPGGEEIHVDPLGSIKIRFPWDRSGIGDDTSSTWVRCLQMAMEGSMLLPRVGWEVPVVYFDGNPDRPFVLGRLYNGAAPTPYGLPGKKATSTLQSATSPADGTTHEIRLADDAGAMEAFVHATKDQTVTVGGSHTVHVTAKETHDVKKSHIVTVHGAQKTHVGAKESITIGGNVGVHVKGARSETVAAMESIKVKGSYTVDSKGLYLEAVGGLYGLECNQAHTAVQGSFTQSVGGPMVITAGLGTNNSVAAARMEDVAGARSYSAKLNYADSTKGAKNITSGASKDDAGTDVVTNVKGVASITVGAGATLTAGGAFAVKAATIEIDSSGTISLKGGGKLKIGGKADVSGGKAVFDADKVKKNKSEVG